MIWFEIVWKLVGNELEFLWKFVESWSNTSLNKSSLNNYLALKRTDSSLEKN